MIDILPSSRPARLRTALGLAAVLAAALVLASGVDPREMRPAADEGTTAPADIPNRDAGTPGATGPQTAVFAVG